MTDPDSNTPPDIMDEWERHMIEQELLRQFEQQYAKAMEDDLARQEAIRSERWQELLQQEQRRQLEMGDDKA